MLYGEKLGTRICNKLGGGERCLFSHKKNLGNKFSLDYVKKKVKKNSLEDANIL